MRGARSLRGWVHTLEMHCRLHVFAVTLRGVLVVTVSDRRNDAAIDMACVLETLAVIKCGYVWKLLGN